MPATSAESSSPPRLTLVGCGRLGSALGRLFRERRVFEIAQVLNRTPESGDRAVAFIGQGRGARAVADLQPTECILIATPDAEIEPTCHALARAGRVDPGSVVFHCSGALDSTSLAAARDCGARVASVHPLKSFADAATAAATFPGTGCALEGDAEALRLLEPAFTSIGGRTFGVTAAGRPVYHAGAVLACNYVVTLVDLGLRCFEQAGIAPDVARTMLEPLVRGTIDNVFRDGPAAALTGPIARGEAEIVRRQLAALAALDPELASLYRALGEATLALARRRDGASDSELERLAAVLRE